jgi:hypothetical protein
MSCASQAKLFGEIWRGKSHEVEALLNSTARTNQLDEIPIRVFDRQQPGSIS